MPRLSAALLALALGLIAAAAHAAPRSPYHRAFDPYVAELNRQCPGRDLQDLTAGDLSYIMEGFVPRLTPARQRAVEKAVNQQCARVEAGLGCANTSSLGAFRRLGVLPAFVHEACATAWTCKGFGDCAQAQTRSPGKPNP